MNGIVFLMKMWGENKQLAMTVDRLERVREIKGGQCNNDQARIRRLQQILGSKRSPPTTADYVNGINSSSGLDEQLNGVTQDAITDLKAEITKVKTDLQKLMEDVHGAKESSRRFDIDAKDRALDIERRFATQMDDFQRCIKSELAVLKKENEKAMLATKESVLKDLSRSSSKKSNASWNIQQSGSQMGCQFVLADAHSNGENFRKDVLLHTSPQHLERTVAAVRGWLRECKYVSGLLAAEGIKTNTYTPTPRGSDAKEQEQRHDDHLAHIPTSLLMSSIKNEARLYSKHHRKAIDLTTLKRSDLQSSSAQAECSISDGRVSSRCSNGIEETAPALRILHRRNMRIADFVGSESEDD